MAEPPPALPRAATLPPILAARLTMPSSASSTTSAHTLGAPPSPSGHVAQNPRVGDPGEVENHVAAGPPLPSEENGMDEDYDSTSLSAICAR